MIVNFGDKERSTNQFVKKKKTADVFRAADWLCSLVEIRSNTWFGLVSTHQVDSKNQ